MISFTDEVDGNSRCNGLKVHMSASRRFANSSVADLDAPHGVGGLEKGYGSIRLRCRRCGFHVTKRRSIDCIFRHCVTSPCHVTVRSNGRKGICAVGFSKHKVRLPARPDIVRPVQAYGRNPQVPRKFGIICEYDHKGGHGLPADGPHLPRGRGRAAARPPTRGTDSDAPALFGVPSAQQKTMRRRLDMERATRRRRA